MLGRAHATVAATVTTHGTPAATSALLQLQQWMQLQQILQQREVQQQQQVQAAFMAVSDADLFHSSRSFAMLPAGTAF
jgi:hypothetical protein